MAAWQQSRIVTGPLYSGFPFNCFATAFSLDVSDNGCWTQDLHVNFRSIIVPEALKLIQSQESSMLGVLSCLENLAMDSNLSFDAMEEQVEVLCGNAITGVPVALHSTFLGILLFVS